MPRRFGILGPVVCLTLNVAACTSWNAAPTAANAQAGSDGAGTSAEAQAGGGASAGGTAPAGAGGNGGTAGLAPCIESGAGGTVATAGGAPAVTLAATPPMGWNSWNKFAGGVSQKVIRATADAMVTSGMKDAGYQYLVIDDTWQAPMRDANGKLQGDLTRFSEGIPALADYVHGKGLKLGIYSDRGTATCSGLPGSLGNETLDAQTFADWGVDYLKYDNCNAADDTMEADYRRMGAALTATGRPIVYSICAWWFFPWMAEVGQLWRTTTDIKDTWATDLHGMISLLNKNGETSARFGAFDEMNPESAAYQAPGLAPYAGPGHWNDPDMLEVGNGGMTPTEYQSHFSLWAMMAAPLIAGNDLRSMTADTQALLTNSEVIAVDQDPRGVQGTPISDSKTLEVWQKPLSGSRTYAVVLFNRTGAAADITLNLSVLHLCSATLRDLWTHTDLGTVSGQYTANVPSHGVTMLKVTGL